MPSPPDSERASVREVLAAAVDALGGQERPGQIAMAEAVGDALADRRHLVVQAGTGTGKSLAYLVPALLHDERVVVATATLALQHQLVERDIPRLVEAVGTAHPEVDTSYAVLKGRSNYACLHRIREGVPDEQGALIEVPEGSLGKKVLELRSWAEKEAESKGSGERDHAPRHTDREWRQVSVSHRDCLGAARCPFGEECFVEQAREKAHRSHLIVTNHSLLAIDAIEGVPMIPDYDVVVVDEAHEVVSRVTQAATDELFAAEVDRAARRSRRWVTEGDKESSPADDLADAGDALAAAIGDCEPGRFDTVPEALADALVLVRDAARACLSAFPKEGDAGQAATPTPAAPRRGVPCRRCSPRPSGWRRGSEADVLWLTEGRRPAAAAAVRRAARGLGPDARQAPRRQDRRDDLGDPDARRRLRRARHLGRASSRPSGSRSWSAPPCRWPTSRADRPASADVQPWVGLDVGSPFDYGRQAILYVARHLPPPGRDGLGRGPARRDRRRSSTRPRAARWGCSAHAGPRRPRPRRSASGCPT